MTRREIWLAVEKMITPKWDAGICYALSQLNGSGAINHSEHLREYGCCEESAPADYYTTNLNFPFFWPKSPAGHAKRRALCRRLAAQFDDRPPARTRATKALTNVGKKKGRVRGKK